MTIKEGIYDIRETLKSFNQDSEISNRHIYFLMNINRRKVIRQHIQKNPGEYRDQLTQTLDCALETVDISRFPISLPVETNIRRTVDVIPDIIGQQVYKDMEVRPIERLQYEIEMVHKTRATEIAYAPKGFVYGFMDDDRHIYLLGQDIAHEFLERIVVTAILEDPKDAESINGSEITEYYLPAHLWVNVKQMVLNSIQLGVPMDTLNDDTDEQMSQTQK